MPAWARQLALAVHQGQMTHKCCTPAVCFYMQMQAHCSRNGYEACIIFAYKLAQLGFYKKLSSHSCQKQGRTTQKRQGSKSHRGRPATQSLSDRGHTCFAAARLVSCSSPKTIIGAAKYKLLLHWKDTSGSQLDNAAVCCLQVTCTT
jgi:hypothetical protein